MKHVATTSLLAMAALAACSPNKNSVTPSAADATIEKFIAGVQAGDDLTSDEKAKIIAQAKAVEANSPEDQKIEKIRSVASAADMLAKTSKIADLVQKQYGLNLSQSRVVVELALYKVDLKDPNSVRHYAELNYALQTEGESVPDAVKQHEIEEIAKFYMKPDQQKTAEKMNSANVEDKVDVFVKQLQDRGSLQYGGQ